MHAQSVLLLGVDCVVVEGTRAARALRFCSLLQRPTFASQPFFLMMGAVLLGLFPVAGKAGDSLAHSPPVSPNGPN
jgi:hypothetical protein